MFWNFSAAQCTSSTHLHKNYVTCYHRYTNETAYKVAVFKISVTGCGHGEADVGIVDINGSKNVRRVVEL